MHITFCVQYPEPTSSVYHTPDYKIEIEIFREAKHWQTCFNHSKQTDVMIVSTRYIFFTEIKSCIITITLVITPILISLKMLVAHEKTIGSFELLKQIVHISCISHKKKLK
jgi:hypothetical protein